MPQEPQQLFMTSKSGIGRSSHYHIVFIDEESGQGFVSEAGSKRSRHSHEIIFYPPETDPQTGEPMGEGKWVVMPGEDGHVHDELMSYQTNPKSNSQDDKDIIAEVVSLYREASEVESRSMKKSEESYRFYRGDQWTSREKEYLRQLNRACLTINYVGKAIDTLIGLQMQQRTDIQYLPQEASDAVVADAFTYTAKHILDSCNFHKEETKSFKDASVAGKGGWDVTVSFEDSLEGDIQVKRFNYKDFKFGPHEDELLTDCEYGFKEKLYSKEKVKQLWPKKADKVQKDFDFYLGVDEGREEHRRYYGRQYAKSDNAMIVMPQTINGNVMVDIARKEYRVLECWRKKYERKEFLVHTETGFVYDAQDWKEADIKQVLETIPGFVSIERLKTRFRITRIAGNVVLSDEDPADLPIDDFFLIPIYCYKEGNEFYGKVEAAKDPQKEVNKRHSQLVDIINRMATYNWFFDDTTFVNPHEEQKFRNTSSSPGSHFKVQTTRNVPVKEEGVKFPSEIVSLLELGESAVDKIMNVVVDPSGANESGSHLLHRQQQSMAGNEFLFDNLSFAKKKLGKILLHMIQRYWSPERMYRLLASQNQQEPIDIGGQPFEEWPEEEIIRALEDTDISQLDVVVSETESSPSMRFSTWLVLSEAAQAGIQVSPDMLIEYMPGISQATKQRLLDSMAQQAEQEGEMADTEAQAEIMKTLIAQGQIPPQVQEEFGVGPSPEIGEGGAPPLAENPTGQVVPKPTEEIYEIINKPDGSGSIVRVVSAPQQSAPSETDEEIVQ